MQRQQSPSSHWVARRAGDRDDVLWYCPAACKGQASPQNQTRKHGPWKLPPGTWSSISTSSYLLLQPASCLRRDQASPRCPPLSPARPKSSVLVTAAICGFCFPLERTASSSEGSSLEILLQTSRVGEHSKQVEELALSSCDCHNAFSHPIYTGQRGAALCQRNGTATGEKLSASMEKSSRRHTGLSPRSVYENHGR